MSYEQLAGMRAHEGLKPYTLNHVCSCLVFQILCLSWEELHVDARMEGVGTVANKNHTLYDDHNYTYDMLLKLHLDA